MGLRTPRVGSASAAAKGTASRHGLGKLKHADLKHLWIRSAVRDKRLVLAKEDGETNFADLMTKRAPAETMMARLRKGGYGFRTGRAPGAPELEEGAVTQRLASIEVAVGMAVLGMGS